MITGGAARGTRAASRAIRVWRKFLHGMRMAAHAAAGWLLRRAQWQSACGAICSFAAVSRALAQAQGVGIRARTGSRKAGLDGKPGDWSGACWAGCQGTAEAPDMAPVSKP